MKKDKLILPVLVLLVWPLMSHAINEQQVRETAHTVYGLYLTPYEAYNMKHNHGDNVLFVDVRSRADLKYVGSTDVIDANIPSRFLDTGYAWSENSATFRTRKNTHFVEDFEKLLAAKKRDKDTPIILMCTSGSRVPKAAKTLKEAGFTTVYSQYQGFEGIKFKGGINKGKREYYGWKNSDLPWSYKLNKEAMYFNFDSTREQAPD